MIGITEYGSVAKKSAAKMQTERALDINIGYSIKIDGKRYKLVKRYPFIYKFEDSNGNMLILTKGDVVQLRAAAMAKGGY